MRLSRFAVLSAVAVGLAVPAGPSAAQNNAWAPGRRFEESSTRVLGSIERVTQKTAYGYVEGICFLTGYLQKGQDVKFTRDFEGGVKYAIVGGGDNGTRDLDLYVLDEDGRVVVKDELTDNIPVVEFIPPRNARYTIRMLMYDGNPGGGFGSLGVLKRNGYEIPVKNQAVALAGLIDEANKVDRAVPEIVDFSKGQNQWSVFGSVIPSGADLTINNITPGGGKRYWVCGADQTADDVDLFLYDQSGSELRRDVRIDPPFPQLSYRTNPGERYSVKIKNVQSRRPSLILLATLALE
jgi:hypothetical protein